MEMTDREYAARVKELSQPSPLEKNCALAFAAGGTICVLGQLLTEVYTALGLDRENAGTAVSVTLIALSALLTALGVYDRLAKHSGAGTLVPITGFANAVVSPAMEFRTEGIVLGTCVKMFSIAGPVIVFGLLASALYGLVLVLLG